jgi:hypothetical protein
MFCVKYPVACFAFLLLFIVVLSVSVSLALTSDQRDEKKATTFHGGDERLFYMQNYFIQNGITSKRDFDDPRSPQFQAVDWLANEDEFEIFIPKMAPDESGEAYEFLTRYIMAVLYYATKGKSWSYDLSFLSEKKTCEWYHVFAPPMGQVGVLCNQNTLQIVGVSFSKS